MALLSGEKSIVSMCREINVTRVKHKERAGGLFWPRGQFVLSGRMVNKHYNSDILQDQKNKFTTVLTIMRVYEGDTHLQTYINVVFKHTPSLQMNILKYC